MRKWTIILMLAAMIFGVMCTQDVQESAFMMQADVIGASWYPRVVGACLVAAAALVAALAAFRRENVVLAGKVDIRTFLTVVVSGAYVLGVCYVGFVISTLIYLTLLTVIFDNLSLAGWRGAIIYSCALTMAFYGFFRFFKVYLPDTVLF